MNSHPSRGPESSYSVIAVTWPFLGGMTLMLLISLGSIHALSAMRAYGAGLGVWIGAEADTSAAMHRYLARPSDAHLAALEQPIRIWTGDNLARLELMKQSADYAFAGRGLSAGGNHPANINGMIWFFTASFLQVGISGSSLFSRYCTMLPFHMS